MQILFYNELPQHGIPGLAKFRKAIEADDFASADVRKVGDNLYRARLTRSDRLLFSLHRHGGQCYCLVLEFIANHAYDKSRFLARGAAIDEDRIPAVAAPPAADVPSVAYINPHSATVNLLDKMLSFDDAQQAIYELPPPLVIIGSAGSGKTALTLEKMKHAVGDILYVSLSSFLVQSARNIYYARDYQNEDQEVEFLSFREFLESLRVPAGRELVFAEFEAWVRRQRATPVARDAHKLFEEFRGVLTGTSIEVPWLERGAYLELGVKQSIFAEEERPQVYELFEKYRRYLDENERFDPNILSHRYLELASPRYDFIVVDEVQDLTNIQLYLILKTLRQAGDFLLCGDSNQIVHPNFFSWAKVKSLFFEQSGLTGRGEVVRILNSNYRNSPEITAVANRILKIKHARFGSIDRESNYLVTSVGARSGTLQLLSDSEQVKRELDARTAHSTQFAVLVMHPEQKALARRWFNTPLVFSVQEAKGLEYASIILFNFISDEEKLFRDVAEGVDQDALEHDDLSYRRVKDKRDRSLEVYKFYINALYVAVTRAVRNLYIVEANHQAPLIGLLQLERFSGELSLARQQSSLDDWQREARKLELQGKQEQADDIRARILQQKPVPWPVLERPRFDALCEKVVRGQADKRERLLALEYAWLHFHRPLINSLAARDFKPARQGEEKCVKQLYRNHYRNYDLKHTASVLRDTEKYGLNHRTLFNLTPLMVAAKLGNEALVRDLIDRGADPGVVADNGLDALQMALEQALTDQSYAAGKLLPIYFLLEPDSLAVQVDGHLVKLDKRLMGLFLLNIMVALFYRHVGSSAAHSPGYSAKQLTELLQQLPAGILPQRRKQQAYISSILSGNEVSREHRYNRKLFLRLQRGVYVINPDLKIRQGESWVGIYQLLRLGDLAAPRFEEVVAPAVADRYRQLGQGADLLKPHPRYQAGIDAFRLHLRQRLESLAGERNGTGAAR